MHKKSFFVQLLDATDSVAWKIFSTLAVTAGIIVTFLNIKDGFTQSTKDWIFLGLFIIVLVQNIVFFLKRK